MSGMNPDPCASYALIDRFICVACSKTPRLVNCVGEGPYVITVECHGQEHTGQYDRKELTFTQRVFETQESES